MCIRDRHQVDRVAPSCETVPHDIRKDLVERDQEPPRGALREGMRAAELLERLDRLKHAGQGARHGERLDRAHQPASAGILPPCATLRAAPTFSLPRVY